MSIRPRFCFFCHSFSMIASPVLSAASSGFPPSGASSLCSSAETAASFSFALFWWRLIVLASSLNLVTGPDFVALFLQKSRYPFPLGSRWQGSAPAWKRAFSAVFALSATISSSAGVMPASSSASMSAPAFARSFIMSALTVLDSQAQCKTVLSLTSFCRQAASNTSGVCSEMYSMSSIFPLIPIYITALRCHLSFCWMSYPSFNMDLTTLMFLTITFLWKADICSSSERSLMLS
mmetsp:Transcript_5682/g.7911  ORF Transcript_5682/g.7911 Transcript_5682/m.7911 type:complete len:235 (+) Transcript_5682:283-987(+)